jgi:hypothetical protein
MMRSLAHRRSPTSDGQFSHKLSNRRNLHGTQTASSALIKTGIKDRPSRLIAALLAGGVAIGVNTALLTGTEELGVKTAHGGFERLIQNFVGMLASLLGFTSWWHDVLLLRQDRSARCGSPGDVRGDDGAVLPCADATSP